MDDTYGEIPLYLYRTEGYCDLWYSLKIYENRSMFHELYMGFTFIWLKGCVYDLSLFFADVETQKKTQ